MCAIEHFSIFQTVICLSLGKSWALELTDIQSLQDIPNPNIPEEGKLNFTETVIKNGYNCEEYDVTTVDGYILKLFHIIGDKTKPVLMESGISDSADSYVLRQEASLAISLSDSGYDLWVANNRGNKYSRRHVSLDPDVDKAFWNFTFNEIASYDLPALIDFVLKKTQQKKLSYIGHSQGTTAGLALLATKPEYNHKIKVNIALAPVCFMDNVELEIIIDFLKLLIPNFDIALPEEFNRQEILKENSTVKTLITAVCTQKDIGYEVCARGVIFPVFGDDPEGIDKDFFPIMMSRYPTSTSVKSYTHFVQIIKSGRFAQFDYGELENQEVYGSIVSPEYDLSKVTTKTALIAAKNDKLSTIPDVEHLKRMLPNVVKYHVMSREKFNHLDHMVGRYMKDELIPLVIEILSSNS